MSYASMLERLCLLTTAGTRPKAQLDAFLERHGLTFEQMKAEVEDLRARIDSPMPITGFEGVTPGRAVRFK